jgi:hypothetical protein
MLRFYAKCLVVVAALALFVGCPQGAGDRPNTVRVGGTITLDGTPVEGATVTFQPTSGGRAAVGKTDASGEYELTTSEADDGVMPGSYKVTVSKTSGGASAGPMMDPSKLADPSKMTPEEMKAYAEQGMKTASGPAEAREEMPEKYTKKETTDLEATVEEGGNKDFSFQLTSGPG